MSQLRGCIFTQAQWMENVWKSLGSGGIDLTPIWNYKLSFFFDFPQAWSPMDTSRNVSLSDGDIVQLNYGCKTKLKEHQISGIKFLHENEQGEDDMFERLWRHSDNHWIHQCGSQYGTKD